MTEIKFRKKKEIYHVTGVPPIHDNPRFILEMARFGCKVEDVELWGTEAIIFTLTVGAGESERVITWITDNAPLLMVSNKNE